MEIKPLTKEEADRINELVRAMWSEEGLMAFLDNADLLMRFNEWIGIALYYKQYALFASLTQAVFSLGYMAGKEPGFDVGTWANAIDEAFKTQ